MTQLLSDLSLDAKRAMVAALVAERARRRTTYPLSSAQRRLWLIDRQVDAAPIYNVSRAFSLEGVLDVTALERSIEEVVRRHAILRTTYAFVDEQPVQIVGDARPFELERDALAGLDEHSREVEIERIVAAEASHRFALDRDSIIRARLVALAQDSHVLVLTVHHIAIDEWSLALFNAELEACYRAFTSGAIPALAPIGMQYADYARAEERTEQTARIAEQLAFWKQRLAGAPSGIALPYRAPRSAQMSYAGAVDATVVSLAVRAALTALGRQAGATPFMTYLAAFAVLLHSVSGARDFVIGSPISGRSGIDVENTIGFFANALALRFELAEDLSFADCVQLTKTVALEAFEHREAPFDRVVSVVSNKRSVGANPVFDVAFAMESAPESSLTLAGLTVRAFEQRSVTTTKFDLLALVRERPAGLEFALHYNTNRFTAATIAELLERLRDLLEQVGAQPDRPLSSLLDGRQPIVAVAESPLATPGAQSPSVEVAPPVEAASDPMVDVLRTRLRSMIEQILDTRPVAAEDDFFALGGHSLLAVRLIARIEDELGVRLPSAAFFARPTLSGLVQAVLRQSRGSAQSPLMVLRRGTGTPVVVFHGDYSGGGFYLRTIVGELGDRTVYALPPHGFDGGTIPNSIEDMAAERRAVLRQAGVRAPFDVVGYCNGAAVALEVARQAAANGEAPPRVFAIGFEAFDRSIVRVTTAVRAFGALVSLDAPAQAKIALRLLRWKRRIRAGGAAEIRPILAEAICLGVERFARRPANFFSAATHDASRPVPDTSLSTPSLLDVYSDRLIRYRPGTYGGPITVFRPAEGEYGEPRDDGPGGWRRVNASADVELITGDHQSAITTYALSLAQRLRARLDR